jgi:hypothetical protein
MMDCWQGPTRVGAVASADHLVVAAVGYINDTAIVHELKRQAEMQKKLD